jgi:hypothetical protein
MAGFDVMTMRFRRKLGFNRFEEIAVIAFDCG